MKAIIQRAYGGPEVLEYGDLPVPEPGPREVRVRVRAAGVDAGTWHLLTGTPHAARVAIGLRRPRALVPGLDVAGIVDAVGGEVRDLRPGDAVFGVSKGSFAEYAIARADLLVPLPDGVDPVAAAATPVSGQTALQSLRQGGLRSGQRVTVTGAGGGVGTFAVQLAADAGAVVTAVCGADKADLVRGLRASHVIDYRSEAIPDGSADLFVDLGGNRTIAELQRATAPGGTVLLTGGEGGGPFLGATVRQLQAAATPWRRPRVRGVVSLSKRADIEALADLLAAGRIRPAVTEVLPLERAADALAALDGGHARGKIVLRVG